jgi:hypothetical protein
MVKEHFKVDGVIENISNDQIFFDHDVTKKQVSQRPTFRFEASTINDAY